MTTTLDVFISSKMVELKAERDALYALLPTLDYGDIKLHAWVFEEDAPATSKSIRDVYLQALQNSALYIGLFGNLYGEYTIDEFDRATEWGMERHIYVKDVDAANRDAKLTDFLNQHGNVQSGITAKWFKTTDELTAAVQKSIETWISERLRSRPGATSATLARDPDDLTEKPRKLIGRDDLLCDVTKLLDDHERVLLQGFGGMGKTALAATLAAEWIKADKGAVLWLKAGSSSADALFEALARPFNAQQAIASQTGDAKTQAVRQLLRQSGAKLLVLDDCWNGSALFAVLKAVPSDMPLIVTARQRYALDKIRDVGELAPADALKLLSHHADHDYTAESTPPASDAHISPPSSSPRPEGEGSGVRVNPDAALLCKTLGHHAFAIEIAGRTLNARKLTPAELLAQIKDAPHDLKTPADFNQHERASVKDLLDASLNVLDAESRTVFLAFGAFFAPQLTVEMLMRYITEKSKISNEQLTEIRKRNPQLPADLSDEQLHRFIQQIMFKSLDLRQLEMHLQVLQDYGLAKRVTGENGRMSSLIARPAFRIHDLSYSYARTQNSDEKRHQAFEACLSYMERYDTAANDDFIALLPELDNLLMAAQWGMKNGHYDEGTEIANVLYVGNGTGGILALLGFPIESIQILEASVEVADKVGDQRAKGGLMGNLGTAYRDVGQVERAIEYHEQALLISRETQDRSTEGKHLGSLGLDYHIVGQVERAIEYHEQALLISRETQDRQGEGNDLGNLGIAYRDLGQVERAIDHFAQALVISREIKNRRGEGNDLGNLGVAFLDLGQTRRAIEYFEQALVISREIKDRYGEANRLSNLGVALGDLGQMRRAIEYYEQALAISREIKQWRVEINCLGNLGNIYRSRGQINHAIEHYEQGLVIAQEMEDQRSEGITLENLGVAYSDIGQIERSIAYYEQALAIQREIGDRRGIGNNLGNLGSAYYVMGQVERALEYYQQARTIFIEIKAPLVEWADQRIAEAHAKLSAPSRDTDESND